MRSLKVKGNDFGTDLPLQVNQAAKRVKDYCTRDEGAPDYQMLTVIKGCFLSNQNNFCLF